MTLVLLTLTLGMEGFLLRYMGLTHERNVRDFAQNLAGGLKKVLQAILN